jgi:Zn-dependent protease
MFKDVLITFASFVVFVLVFYYFVDLSLFFSIGIAILILVHEFGHIIALKQLGMSIKGTYFIPFLGAVVVSKERLKTRDHYAYMKYMGPLVGSIGVLITVLIFIFTKDAKFLGLAYAGAFINLINLTPVTLLDGYGVLIGINKRAEWLGILMSIILGFFIFKIYVLTFLFIIISTMFSEEGESEGYGFRMHEFIIGIICFLGIVITISVQKFDITDSVLALVALYVLIVYYRETKIKKIDLEKITGNKDLLPLNKKQKISWAIKWIGLVVVLSLFLYSVEYLDFAGFFIN